MSRPIELGAVGGLAFVRPFRFAASSPACGNPWLVELLGLVGLRIGGDPLDRTIERI